MKYTTPVTYMEVGTGADIYGVVPPPSNRQELPSGATRHSSFGPVLVDRLTARLSRARVCVSGGVYMCGKPACVYYTALRVCVLFANPGIESCADCITSSL